MRSCLVITATAFSVILSVQDSSAQQLQGSSPTFNHPNANTQIQQSSFEQPQPAQSGFPSLTPQSNRSSEKTESKKESLGPLITTGSSLVVVLGLFAGLVWITRKYGNVSVAKGGIPSGVLKSLGSTAIDARTHVTMLRCGNRIVVMAQTANGIYPLSEITDPVEVNRLTIACTGDAGPTFAETLRQIEPQPESQPQPQRGRAVLTA